MTKKSQLTDEQRAEIRRRYTRGRSHAAKAKGFNDGSIAISLGVSNKAVYSVSKGRRPRNINDVLFERIRSGVLMRHHHQRMSGADSAVQIAREMQLSADDVRNLCNYIKQSERMDATTAPTNRSTAMSFLTAPALIRGNVWGITEMSDNREIAPGRIFPTNEGGSVTVSRYGSCRNIEVVHNDKHKHKAVVQADNLRKGKVKNPYFQSVFGVGFLGAGKYKRRVDGVKAPAHRCWQNMLKRAYSAKCHAVQPAYLAVFVDERWHNFQVFAEWFYGQPNSGASGFDLDKDLIVEGNSVYGPEVCSFVPRSINTLLSYRGQPGRDVPPGVSVCGRGFHSQISVDGKIVHLGTHDTADMALNVYVKAKQINIRTMAEKWKGNIDPRVYAHLLSWAPTNMGEVKNDR